MVQNGVRRLPTYISTVCYLVPGLRYLLVARLYLQEYSSLRWVLLRFLFTYHHQLSLASLNLVHIRPVCGFAIGGNSGARIRPLFDLPPSFASPILNSTKTAAIPTSASIDAKNPTNIRSLYITNVTQETMAINNINPVSRPNPGRSSKLRVLSDNAEHQTHRDDRQERKHDVNVQEVCSGKKQ